MLVLVNYFYLCMLYHMFVPCVSKKNIDYLKLVETIFLIN